MASNSRTPMNFLLLILLLFIGNNNLVCVSEALWLTFPSSGTKCVSEEIQSSVVVVADYIVLHDDSSIGPAVTARVTSPYGNTLHHKENVTNGQFAFTTTEPGNYMACFSVDNKNQAAGTSLNLDWKIGIAAKDWDSVAKKEHRIPGPMWLPDTGWFRRNRRTKKKKKEHIEGVELDLMRLQGIVQAIHSNILFLKGREAEMRSVSEITNARVAWFSIMSLGVCIMVSGFQLWNLKRHFEKKKLI